MRGGEDPLLEAQVLALELLHERVRHEGGEVLTVVVRDVELLQTLIFVLLDDGRIEVVFGVNPFHKLKLTGCLADPDVDVTRDLGDVVEVAQSHGDKLRSHSLSEIFRSNAQEFCRLLHELFPGHRLFHDGDLVLERGTGTDDDHRNVHVGILQKAVELHGRVFGGDLVLRDDQTNRGQNAHQLNGIFGILADDNVGPRKRV